MHLKQSSSREMNTMFQSLEEAIILVKKDKLVFKNEMYEELMDRVYKDLNMEVPKGLSLDPKFLEVFDENKNSKG